MHLVRDNCSPTAFCCGIAERKTSLTAQQEKLQEDIANTKRELQYLEMKEKALLPGLHFPIASAVFHAFVVTDSSSEQMLKKLNLIKNHMSVKAAAASTDLQHIEQASHWKCCLEPVLLLHF